MKEAVKAGGVDMGRAMVRAAMSGCSVGTAGGDGVLSSSTAPAGGSLGRSVLPSRTTGGSRAFGASIAAGATCDAGRSSTEYSGAGW